MHKLKSNYILLSPQDRLYRCELPIIGLTGGIATGKSSAAKYFRSLDIPLIDADKLVHEVYKDEESFRFIQEIAPSATKTGSINFSKLRNLFFSHKDIKLKIEKFIYQRMPDKFQQEFARQTKDSPFEYIIYDVPLLFEKDLATKVDINALIFASRDIQIKRLMARDNQSAEQAEKILQSQIPIEEKRKRAQFCVDNTSDFGNLNKSLSLFLETITI